MNPWAIVSALVILFASHTFAYRQGFESCAAKGEKATTTESLRQSDDAGELKAAEAENAPKVIYRIKVVREAVDPSGCRDLPMPPDVQRALGMPDDQIRPVTDKP